MSLLVLQMCRFSSKQPSPQLRNSVPLKTVSGAPMTALLPFHKFLQLSSTTLQIQFLMTRANDLASGFLEGKKNKRGFFAGLSAKNSRRPNSHGQSS